MNRVTESLRYLILLATIWVAPHADPSVGLVLGACILVFTALAAWALR